MLSLFPQTPAPIGLRPPAAGLLLALFFVLISISCSRIDLYEKVDTIPAYQWKSSYRPRFQFEIKDTAAPYQLFLIFRHNDRYNYNNLWLNIYTQTPGSKAPAKVQYEIPLATNEKGWLGSGLDDLYEHRVALTPATQKFYFRQPGLYTFTIEHIMREDPLANAMNVGLRLEKKQP
ncbi:gliding motility lipoprotein GldH [Paraflavisolibacter sp. H34]|uniref:gliding motility lipoprotein GldH n=1 Tax=Huijunlia imazamoxiresistens TaxID=3127457 RepID=UPI003016083B